MLLDVSIGGIVSNKSDYEAKELIVNVPCNSFIHIDLSHLSTLMWRSFGFNHIILCC